jgi:spermidine synthase
VLRPGPDGALLIPDRTYPRAFTLRVGQTDQSYVDLDDPTRLEFDYVQRMADIIDSAAAPGERVRIVHVGGAGLTLPRYVAATRPQSAQVVFEPDVDLTEFVREYLPLPPRSGIKVRADDGRSGTEALRDAYADLLVVDAFVGARVPADLSTVEFFTAARRVVGDTGMVLMNVTDRGPFGYARRVLAGMMQLLPHVVFCAEPATMKGRRFGNVIIAGSPQPMPVAEIAQRAGSSAYPYRVLHGPRLTQLAEGASPLTDADGEWSPNPPLFF